MNTYLIAGGWGYNNLGDEAILAGYLNHLAPTGDLYVSSVNPARTAAAQGGRVPAAYVKEGRVNVPRGTVAILGGGGYLNGAWQPELSLKMRRLARDFPGSKLNVHAVEARRLDGRFTSRASRQLFGSARVSVRDDESRDVLRGLQLATPAVLPDAISLLYPHILGYIREVPELEGKILLNLLNIAERGDSAESEVDATRWVQFCDDLIRELGDRAVGMVIGGGDYRFLKRWPELALVEPTTVAQLLSTLSSASGTLSVRMHPALLSTMLGKPTVSVPYCGKVRPTLSRIGVESALMAGLDVDMVLSSLLERDDHTSAWTASHEVTVQWIEDAIADSGQD